MEKQDQQADNSDDKLSMFRHQAATVERRKNAAAEKVQETRAELQRIEQEVREKKDQMRDAEGNEVVTSIQVRNNMRKN